jgi:small subunit ribosomal protein S17
MKGIRRKTRTGVVVSSKMDKTVVVAVERRLRHPVYGKVVRKSPHFYAHDGKNQCREGDLVRIAESRPLSKLKRWRVVEVVKKAQ